MSATTRGRFASDHRMSVFNIGDYRISVFNIAVLVDVAVSRRLG